MLGSCVYMKPFTMDKSSNTRSRLFPYNANVKEYVEQYLTSPMEQYLTSPMEQYLTSPMEQYLTSPKFLRVAVFH